MMLETMHFHAKEIWSKAIAAVRAEGLVLRMLSWDGKKLTCSNGASLKISREETLYLIGAGKAACNMVDAVMKILTGIKIKGIIITKYGHGFPIPGCRIYEAGHPVPDKNGLSATRSLIEWLHKDVPQSAPVLIVITGGASALMCFPAAGLSLDDKINVSNLLLSCGADIKEINAVRKHISAIKGGRLAKLLGRRPVLTLLLSDVIGDRIDSIASGPTVPDETSYKDALDIFKKYKILDSVPLSVRQFIKDGLKGHHEETLKKGNPIFENKFHFVIGNNLIACRQAKSICEKLNYNPLFLSSSIEGDTDECAKFHLAIAREIITSSLPVPPPACVISGGETTVTIRGNGKGGRNQQFVLSCVREIESWKANTVIVSVGTDGTDGPTDAAGAIADTQTLRRALSMGMDPADYLARNDSYNFFKNLDALIKTGPTGTNVMDLRLFLIDKKQ